MLLRYRAHGAQAGATGQLRVIAQGLEQRSRTAARALGAELDPDRAGISILDFVNVLMDDAANAAAFPKRAVKAPRCRSCTTAYKDTRVGEIALACGFNDLSYFSRSFRRRFGDSPRGFRA